MVDGPDNFPRVPDHVVAVGHRAADGEELPVGLLVDGDEVTLGDVVVGLGDARPHDVRAVRDERDSAGVDRDDVFLRRILVGPPDGEEGVVVDVEDERFPVDEDHVPVAVVELDLLETVGVQFDAEVVGQGRRDGVDLVRPEVMPRFDVHTCEWAAPDGKRNEGRERGSELFQRARRTTGMRVVTLLPSATEIVYALGMEPVGVSHECDYPPAAREQPSVNRSRVDPEASSGEINEQVAEAESGDGVYAIDREALATLDPDVVITQGVCDVCAVDHVQVAEAVADLGLDAEVLTLDVHSLEDLFESIHRVGAAIDRDEEATDLVATLRERVAAVETTAARAEATPTVAVLDWLDPVMVAGHWIPEMVEMAGGAYGMAERGAHSRPREWDEVREYDPDVLVAAPCGFDIAQTRENLDDLTERPGFDDLSAVRDGRAFVMDGHHYVNRSGPRLVDTLEFLAALVHPELFDAPPRDAVQAFSTLRA